MRLAIVSAFVLDNDSVVSGREGGLEYSYARAFLALGHDVVRVRDTTDGSFRLPKQLRRIEVWARLQLYEDNLCKQVLDANVELVLVVKGRGVSPRVVKRWRQAGLRVVNLMPDNPFEAAAIGLGAPRLLAQYQAVDLVLVHDRIAVGQLRECGVRSEYIAFARDPSLHNFELCKPKQQNEYNVVFVGNPDSERIRYLRAITDLGLAVFGAWNWANLSPSDPLKPCIRGGPQRADAMVDAMRKASLSINILRLSQKAAHNMRTFEIPACGVCCLSEFSIGVAEHMQPGVEIQVFRSPADLRNVVMKLLASPEEVNELSKSAPLGSQKETYEKRALELLQMLE